MSTPIISTDDYRAQYGRAPRGRGTWRFIVKGEVTREQCLTQHGEAHDAHMRLNSECPWCGAGEAVFWNLTYSQAVRIITSKYGPGPWHVQP